MSFLFLLVAVSVAYGLIEYRLHQRRLARIPVRVLVNGTRGKSSVTRLIAAGLRAGGRRVIAKTTGTSPRFIMADDQEVPIRRLGKANIIENLRIVRQALQYRPDAIVFECMALVPKYQWIDAHRLIQPTHGVITNARADHLDVMGPTVSDVAKALSNSIPRNGLLFTADEVFFPEFARRADRRQTRAFQARPDSVTDEEMQGFGYVEHKENVALALLVCEMLGVERKTALAGMHRSLPDPGAMRIYQIQHDGKRFEFVNTLAANDPDSIARLWAMMKGRRPERIVLVNCRADRTDRSRQLAELCAREFDAKCFVITGGLTAVFERAATRQGIPRSRLVNLGDNLEPEKVYDGVLRCIDHDALIFATGNIVGYGSSLVDYFAAKAGTDS
ncbi:MAG: poly-gamma-glutamate synthase PgsB [candidate division WOR-3 bacterium]